MSTHPFGVEASPGMLRVWGEVDLAVAGELLGAILCGGLAGDGAVLRVDLGQVTFLDSTGVGALLQGYQRLRSNGVAMRVINPSPCVQKVFDTTGISEYLGVPAVAPVG